MEGNMTAYNLGVEALIEGKMMAYLNMIRDVYLAARKDGIDVGFYQGVENDNSFTVTMAKPVETGRRAVSMAIRLDPSE